MIYFTCTSQFHQSLFNITIFKQLAIPYISCHQGDGRQVECHPGPRTAIKDLRLAPSVLVFVLGPGQHPLRRCRNMIQRALKYSCFVWPTTMHIQLATIRMEIEIEMKYSKIGTFLKEWRKPWKDRSAHWIEVGVMGR